MTDWLHVRRSDAALLLAFPHGGSDLPEGYGDALRSATLARLDTDWHIRVLYEGLADATFVWTDISRAIIDCNRDPSGASLYPGQATTGLCPMETFDGVPLYRDGATPDVATRRDAFFTPYHDALSAELARLKTRHERIVLLDCHSIRSRVPRLFDGELPEVNIGTDGGKTCDPALERAVMVAASGRSHVLNGRFRGGWTTRHYGRPATGVHALQIEIAMRAYLREPDRLAESPDWPPPYDADFASPLRADLARMLAAAATFGARS